MQAPEPVQPPLQPPNDELPAGVAVRVTVVPLGKLVVHVTFVLAQLKPEGETVTVPVPRPEKVSVRVGSPPPPPPAPVKQTPFAAKKPVTTAPDAERPPASALVCTVAEMRVPPQALPVAAIR